MSQLIQQYLDLLLYWLLATPLLIYIVRRWYVESDPMNAGSDTEGPNPDTGEDHD